MRLTIAVLVLRSYIGQLGRGRGRKWRHEIPLAPRARHVLMMMIIVTIG